MNLFERPEKLGLEAKIDFLDGDYRIMRQGSFVRCAVTSQPIPLDDLRYWSVKRQEAYATPEASLAAERGKR
ncbi:MAG: DUF2093 domain-containing protein [Proteobacteria bacterium]|nr:DUF2093 domain-containing protein [Pseudomonadota bacterium]